MKRVLAALAAVVCSAVLFTGCGKQSGNTLNIFIWSAYLPDEVIAEFTKRTGIRVNYDTYDSNEALLEKLQSGVADYDIVVPSDYMVTILASEGLVQPLDHSKITTWGNLNPKFLNKKFDPENKVSMPYFWGTTGIGYNREKFPDGVNSWGVLFDPANAGRILMLDDPRECFAVALKYMGKSLNETDPEILRQAAELLKQQKKLVKTYNSGDFHNILASGDVDLAHGYNGQMAEVIAEAPDRLAYVVPSEGGTFWMDAVCIPAKSRNVENAYAFLSFIMEPEINAQIVNGCSYASANEAAKPFIDPSILGNDDIYPPDEVLDRCEFIEDIGETATLLDRLWTEIKAQ
ncbi:MAG: spermidine/putrescine ABC transporter substrate-binding protein [Kiritimatiellae bacterium]|nr:spermidine/putrescine ABC transporter substrate-binding protein [Kiritimatiellia bacterium]